jgi:hypothetical protein
MDEVFEKVNNFDTYKVASFKIEYLQTMNSDSLIKLIVLICQSLGMNLFFNK